MFNYCGKFILKIQLQMCVHKNFQEFFYISFNESDMV